MTDILIPAADMRDLAQRIFLAVGCSPAEGERIARHLVIANLTGHDSHGVIRIPRYLQWMEKGWLRPNRSVTAIADSPAMALLEGHHGFGQTLGEQAVDIGVAKARAAGVSVVALRNAGHLGRIGDWAEQAAEAGLVSIHLVNVAGSILVAPFGGVERRMATNPVAIGVPLPGQPPIILDFATSAVAEGKAMVAHSGGKPLPEGVLIAPDGQLTSDPAVFYGPKIPGETPDHGKGKGALRAMGEHKGSGLSFMIELLAGALTGSGCAGPGPRPIANGMLSIYLRPDAFAGAEPFAAEARAYLEFFKSARPAKPGGEVLAPGEPERRSRALREAKGLPLSPDTWNSIRAAGARLGVSA
jgi:hydroxycarboxylate dehydrogenase B